MPTDISLKSKKHHLNSPYSHYAIKTCEIIIVFFWLITLQNSDAIFIPYLIIGVVSILSCVYRDKFGCQEHWKLASLFSSIFTFFICSANYSLFPSFSNHEYFLVDIITIISLIVGSFLAFYNILIHIPLILSRLSIIKPNKKDKFYSLKPSTVFFISFIAITVVYLLILFICKYPGNLSIDSIRQITQNITGEYSNHHPFIHTIIIGAFIKTGQKLFGDINAGVALCSFFQILFMASIFSYSIVTTYQKGYPKSIIIILLLVYLFCPYHIMYSMTIWKDIPFAGFVLLFSVAQYRIFLNIGAKPLNYTLLTIGSLGVCLFRNNGLYAMIILLILFLALFWRHFLATKQLLLSGSIIAITIICSLTYQNILLPAFNVTPSEITESLSLPIQQATRAILDHDLSTEQLNHIGKLINKEQATSEYIPWISDPMKKQVWQNSNQGIFIKDNAPQLIKEYLNLGFSYPLSFYQGWVDLTRGYFNGGYIYWVLYYGIESNEIGISKTNTTNLLSKIFDTYLKTFEENLVLRIFYSIGFAVWMTIFLLYIAIIKKNNKICLLISLPLLILTTLLVATPVFSEFRYAYSIFCCLPFLSIIVVFSARQHKTSN